MITSKIFRIRIYCIAACLFMPFCTALVASAQVKAKVEVIIEKLPIDRQEKMRNFDKELKRYIENSDWFGNQDKVPVNVSLQLFLTDSPNNLEDRYNCEFLISSSDVQYFDRRVRFPYQPGDVLTYNEHNIDPLTGIIDFYINMILGNELDKYSSFGGDFYYSRARNIAGLGKSLRSEYVQGWILWREELIKRVFEEPFITFRKAKDHYFYGMYVRSENLAEARKQVARTIELMETVMEKKSKMDEPEQFLNAHYLEIIELFKEAKNKNEIFKKLAEIDPSHKDLYEEHVTDS